MSVRSALYKKIEPELPLDTHPEVRLDFDQVRQAAKAATTGRSCWSIPTSSEPRPGASRPPCLASIRTTR